MDLVTYAVLNKKIDTVGNVPDEKITAAVNTYLNENPPVTGATAEQAAQIDKNVADIGELKGDLSQLSEEIGQLKQNGTGGSSLIGVSKFPYKLTNSSKTLTIPTYDGSGQAMHPKILYFKDGWNGYKFWMAFTPYPNSEDYYENPSIVVSNDAETWVVPSGLKNPLDKTTDKTVYYNSDTHLVYREDLDRLECWYRKVVNNPKQEIIYRRCSTDGITWTEREVLFDTLVDTDVLPDTFYNCLSPAVNYYNGKYRIWGASGPQNSRYLSYWESVDGDNWQRIRNIEIPVETHSISHHDVIFFEGKFICIFSAVNKTNGALEHLMYSHSYDNEHYSEAVAILDRSASGNWDDARMYRPSWVVVDDELWVCYCATKSDGTWATGIIKIPNTRELSVKEYMDKLFVNIAYGDLSNALNTPDAPDEPDNPEVTLSSISAIYNGGSVLVGTSVNSLNGIVVTARYSDGTTKTVTGYTLSGTITEGNNTITVSYNGKTTTFSVVGIASGGDEPDTPTDPYVDYLTSGVYVNADDKIYYSVNNNWKSYINIPIESNTRYKLSLKNNNRFIVGLSENPITIPTSGNVPIDLSYSRSDKLNEEFVFNSCNYKYIHVYATGEGAVTELTLINVNDTEYPIARTLHSDLYINSNSNTVTASAGNQIYAFTCEPNTTYKVSREKTTLRWRVAYTTKGSVGVNAPVIGVIDGETTGELETIITTGENATYILVWFTKSNEEDMNVAITCQKTS